MRAPVALTATAAALLALAPDQASAAASGWAGDARLGVRLVTAADTAGTSAKLQAGLQIRLKPGWHTYWRSPGDAGFPPRLDWSGSENVRAVSVAWPAPVRHVQSGLRGNVYDRDVTLPLSVEVEHPGAPVRLRLSADLAGCAEICIPYRAALPLDLPAGPGEPGPEAGLIATGRARVPGGLSAAGLEAALTRRSGTAGHPLLTILLRSRTGPLAAPVAFAERAGRSLDATVTVDQGRGGAWVKVALPPGQDGETAPVTVTFVDGDRSAEWSPSPTGRR